MVKEAEQTVKTKYNGRPAKPPASKPEVIDLDGPEYQIKRICDRIGSFPRYNSPASVYIQLGKTHHYVLDKVTLQRSSDWFARAFEQPCVEPDPDFAEKAKADYELDFRFRLVLCEESPGWKLQRTVSQLATSWILITHQI